MKASSQINFAKVIAMAMKERPSAASIQERMTIFNKPAMDPRMWHKVAALSGIAALCLGTYGAHIYKPQNLAFKEIWHRASLYHLVHTAALLAAPVVKHPNIFGGFLTAGILAFSGTCYTVAFLEDKKYSFVAPYGGFAFIGAWATLLF